MCCGTSERGEGGNRTEGLWRIMKSRKAAGYTKTGKK